MRSKKFFLMIFAFVLAFAAGAFAVSGEGDFGSGSGADLIDNPAPSSVTVTVTVNKNDDNNNRVDTSTSEGTFSTTGQSTNYNDTYNTTPVVTPAPRQEDYDFVMPTIDIKPQEAKTLFGKGVKPERHSQDAKKVLWSYKLRADITDVMVDKHKNAERASGNQEKAERYAIIANTYREDYFAAYKVAEAYFNMGKYSAAKTWIENSIKRYDGYVPAKNLRKQIDGALARNSEDD